MSNENEVRWGVRCVYPLSEPRNPDKEREARVGVIEMCMALVNDYHLGRTSEVEPAEDAYGRYVETYPPGMSTLIVSPEGTDTTTEVPLPEPVIMFLPCREEAATHVVYMAEVTAKVDPRA